MTLGAANLDHARDKSPSEGPDIDGLMSLVSQLHSKVPAKDYENTSPVVWLGAVPPVYLSQAAGPDIHSTWNKP